MWVVRARREFEDLALEKDLAVVGWEEMGDLSGIRDREALLEALRKAYPEAKERTLLNWRSQQWAFVHEIKTNDLIALPLKSRPFVAFGRVTGPYEYRADLPIGARHTRPVQWIGEIPRTELDSDLLYSLGAYLTVGRIRRDRAEERITALLGKMEVSKEGSSQEEKDASPSYLPERGTPPVEGEEDASPDLETLALDGIRRFIEQRFKGHRLTDLVAAVLTAQGYTVWVAPPGPDGGIDILAGSGELGFEQPRIAVQVKSGDVPTDIKTLRELQGAMKSVQAQQGLLVSWSGFKSSVEKERNRYFFEIRLWSSEDLLREIFRLYEKLPEEIQAQLPLKRIWVLVPPSEEV
ncbi:MAG: restriction endonuclease [Thermaceae bacterium]